MYIKCCSLLFAFSWKLRFAYHNVICVFSRYWTHFNSQKTFVKLSHQYLLAASSNSSRWWMYAHNDAQKWSSLEAKTLEFNLKDEKPCLCSCSSCISCLFICLLKYMYLQLEIFELAYAEETTSSLSMLLCASQACKKFAFIRRL
jgi:hypothetical protein